MRPQYRSLMHHINQKMPRMCSWSSITEQSDLFSSLALCMSYICLGSIACAF